MQRPNKMAKKNIRADKRAYCDSLAVEPEEAAHHGNMRAVHANTQTKHCGIFCLARETHKRHKWGLDCWRRRTKK